jgi:hypothetical protein
MYFRFMMIGFFEGSQGRGGRWQAVGVKRLRPA